MLPIRFLHLLLLCAFAWPIGANPARSVSDEVMVSLVSEHSSLRPGEEQWLGLLFEHSPGWHTYWENAGDSGLPTRLSWTLPEGIEVGAIAWPHPQRFDLAGIVNYGYDGRVLLPVPLTVDRQLASTSAAVELAVRVDYLVCEEECIPGRAELKLSLAVDSDAAITAEHAADFADARRRLPQLVDWPAQAQIGEETVAIEVELPDSIRLARGWDLFPVQKEVLANGDGRKVLERGLLRWQAARSDFFRQAPERLDLVIVAEPGRAWRVSATVHEQGLPAPGQLTDPAADASRLGLALALLFALLGGMVLNLMPCVFPVLALKAIGLRADTAGLRHGLLYTLGVVGSFLVLAGLLLALRAGGEALGWGFQLQSPWLVGLLAYLFLAMGLSLSGVYTFGERLMGVGQQLTEGESDRAAFFTGVLAAVVASPCTAPLMGAALGYALTQPAWVALLVFATLGMGLALPFLAVSLSPALARRLPRPGAWMDRFKQILAFPLYLSAVWLLWVFGVQQGTLGMGLLAAGSVFLAFGLWLAGNTPRGQGGWRLARILALLASFGAGAYALLSAANIPPQASAEQTATGEHEPYEAARLAELRRAGTPVLVNMTAAWCITCLANERVALSSTAVREALRERGIVYVKGDWTLRDAAITDYLAQYGRSGVPLYVYYPPNGGSGRVLPQLLTADLVLAALDQP